MTNPADASRRKRPALYVVAVNPDDLTSSFTRVHIDRLPADAVAIHGYLPANGAEPVLDNSLMARGGRYARMYELQRWQLREGGDEAP